MDLHKNEQVIMKLKRNWSYFFWPFVIGWPTMGLGWIWLLYRIIVYFGEDVVLTNQRFNMKTGIFSSNTISTKLDKIQDVYCKQGFFDKMFGCGTISIQTASTFGMISYSNVANPDLVKAAIESAAEEYQTNKNKELAKEIASATANKA